MIKDMFHFQNMDGITPEGRRECLMYLAQVRSKGVKRLTGTDAAESEMFATPDHPKEDIDHVTSPTGRFDDITVGEDWKRISERLNTILSIITLVLTVTLCVPMYFVYLT